MIEGTKMTCPANGYTATCRAWSEMLGTTIAIMRDAELQMRLKGKCFWTEEPKKEAPNLGHTTLYRYCRSIRQSDFFLKKLKPTVGGG